MIDTPRSSPSTRSLTSAARSMVTVVVVAVTAALVAGIAHAQTLQTEAPQTEAPPTAVPHALCATVWADRSLCAIAGPGAPPTADPDAALASLAERFARVDIVLLGEVHDNAHHHRLRADLVRRIVAVRRAAGRPDPALVFEHIREDQRAAVAAVQALPRNADVAVAGADFARALDWERSGWPGWPLFAPLFETALGLDLAVLPGDAPRAAIRELARGQGGGPSAEERAALGIDQPLPDVLQGALLDELAASHCGLMPRTAFSGMALAQRYRDAHLARSVAEAARTRGAAILIAGNGHVRRDRGVPRPLATLAPGLSVAVVTFEEASGTRPLEAYRATGADGTPLADLVVVTPATARPDPCAQMRARFGKKG